MGKIIAGAGLNGTITELDISQNNMTAESSENLYLLIVSLKTLIKLNVSGNDLGNTSAEAISRGLSHYRCSLQHLTMSETGVTNKGFSFLFREGIGANKTLKHLTADQNSLDQTTNFRPIRLAFERSRSMEYLSLQSCMLRDAVGIPLAQSLQTNRFLTHINLSHNHLGD